MPVLSHQDIISGFLTFKDGGESLRDTLSETHLRDFKQKKNASFSEAKKLFLRVIETKTELQHADIPQWVDDYVSSLNLSDRAWVDLCQRDFGMAVDEKEAKTAYQGTFLTMLYIELGSTELSSFQYSMERQVLAYLEKNKSMPWAKVGLSYIGPRKNKPEIFPSEYPRIHRAYRAMIEMSRSDQDGAAKLKVVEDILNQDEGLIFHCKYGLMALNFVASNYRYLVERHENNDLHKEAYLGAYAPVRGIESISYSDDLVAKAVKWNLQLLTMTYSIHEIPNNIRALTFLIYLAYQHHNLEAQKGLKEFFANINTSVIFEMNKRCLFSNLHKLYQEDSQVAAQLKSAPDLKNCQSLEELSQLVLRWQAAIAQSVQEQKQKAFAIVSGYYAEEAKERSRRETPSDKKYFNDQSGVPSMEDLYEWLAKFFENPEAERPRYPAGKMHLTDFEFLLKLFEGKPKESRNDETTSSAINYLSSAAGRSPIHTPSVAPAAPVGAQPVMLSDTPHP